MVQEIAASRFPEEHISVVLVSGFMTTTLLILVYGHYLGSQVEWLTLIILASQGSWVNRYVTKASLNLCSEFQNSLDYITSLVSLTKKRSTWGSFTGPVACVASRMHHPDPQRHMQCALPAQTPQEKGGRCPFPLCPKCLRKTKTENSVIIQIMQVHTH